MCVVSMISDHYMQRWPQPAQFPPQLFPDYSELLRKAAEYDRIMSQPECPAPEKVTWQQELEKIMREQYGIVPKVKPLTS
jgi:hypothetical protein